MSSVNYLKGIDVSHYQGGVNWGQVKSAGCAFAYAKATEGTSVTDAQFAANWSGMKGAGLLRGAYHFYRAQQDSTQQAEHFLSVVTLSPGDLPPFLDIEVNDGVTGSALIDGVQNWLETVSDEMGVTPLIYTLTSFWNANLNDQFGQYPLWLARYSSAPGALPEGWSDWTFWQYSQSLNIAGVNGPADHDYFNGSLSDLQALTVQADSNT
jgi:lysozyme